MLDFDDILAATTSVMEPKEAAAQPDGDDGVSALSLIHI